ncbi:MAG: hypothetical protein GY696_32065 [Gammaproteobacteria bacterium]|nr:hypothetical protein [Gammaproteobacteria bacterium]
MAATGSTLLLAVQNVCQLPVPPWFSMLVRMDLWRLSMQVSVAKPSKMDALCAEIWVRALSLSSSNV